jgi:hypothetical protein
MNELQLVNKEGAITSSEIGLLIEKSMRAIIRQLTNLESIGEIKILVFRTNITRRNVYVSNKVFNNLYNAQKS